MTLTDEQIEKAALAWEREYFASAPSYDHTYSGRVRRSVHAAIEAVMSEEEEPVAWTLVSLDGFRHRHLFRTADDAHCHADHYDRVIPLFAHPALNQDEEVKRLREAHRENIRLLSLVAHDLVGRIEGGKVAAIHTAIDRALTALAEGESHE